MESSMLIETRKRLLDAVACIGQRPPGQVEDAVEDFHALRSAVTRASGSRADELLADLQPKAAVIEFLFGMFEARQIYRRQVSGVLTVLFKVDTWLEALRENKDLCARMPEELGVCVPTCTLGACATLPSSFRRLNSQSETTDSAGDPSFTGSFGYGSFLQGGLAESERGFGEPEPEAGSSTEIPPPGRRPAGPFLMPSAFSPGIRPRSPVRSPQRRLSPRTLEIREAVAAATKLRAVGKRQTYSTAPTTLELLADSKQHLEALDFRSSGGMDEVFAAFETFRRALVQIKSKADEYALEEFEPKHETLEFLVSLYESKRKYRARVADVLVRLLSFDRWRTSAAAEMSVLAIVQDWDAYYIDEAVQVAPETEIGGALQEAALAAAARGSIGSLCVQVIAAHNLVGVSPGGHSDMYYVRLSFGHVFKRTHKVSEHHNPAWHSMPLFFDVLRTDAMLKCEVLVVSNLTGERSLGAFSIRCPGLHVCGEPPASRYPLVGVPHGELELKLAFVRWEPSRSPSPLREDTGDLEFALTAATKAQKDKHPNMALDALPAEVTAAPTTPLTCEAVAVPSSLPRTLAAPEAQSALDAPNQFSVHWAVSWRTTRTSVVVASLAIAMAWCNWRRR